MPAGDHEVHGAALQHPAPPHPTTVQLLISLAKSKIQCHHWEIYQQPLLSKINKYHPNIDCFLQIDPYRVNVSIPRAEVTLKKG